MRSQRLQPALLEEVRDVVSKEAPQLDDEINAFADSKPTLAQLEDFLSTKALTDNTKVKEALDRLREPVKLEEGIRELAEDEIAQFRAGLERAAGPEPVSDYSDDLKQSAHL